jgi:hypothetical protein
MFDIKEYIHIDIYTHVYLHHHIFTYVHTYIYIYTYTYTGQIKWTNRPFLSLDKNTIMNYTIIIFDTKEYVDLIFENLNTRNIYDFHNLNLKINEIQGVINRELPRGKYTYIFIYRYTCV